VEDMSSSIIIEAYKRQMTVDPGNFPVWLSALKAIGSLRGDEDKELIDVAVNEAYADKKYAVEDVAAAYQYFGLHSDDPNLTEDSIIGKFYAFVSSTNNDVEARRQLWRIGDSLASEAIKSAAEDRALIKPCYFQT
jgi:ubiquitin carboxyl-terminal hydrolase 25/28